MKPKTLKIFIKEIVNMGQGIFEKRPAVIRKFPFISRDLEFEDNFFIIFKILSRPPNFFGKSCFSIQAY